jgi:hypothetical protein
MIGQQAADHGGNPEAKQKNGECQCPLTGFKPETLFQSGQGRQAHVDG